MVVRLLQPQSIDNTQLCTGMSPLEVAKDSNEDDDSYEDEDDREAAQLKKREIVKLLEAAQSGGLQWSNTYSFIIESLQE